MYDYVNFRLPVAFDRTWLTNEQYNLENNLDGPELRNIYDFKIYYTRYVYLDNHPVFSFHKKWNSLDLEFKSIDSKSLFISRIKHFLLHSE